MKESKLNLINQIDLYHDTDNKKKQLIACENNMGGKIALNQFAN
jgi:hypothetical protein